MARPIKLIVGMIVVLVVSVGCLKNQRHQQNPTSDLPDALPHGSFEKIADDIFTVAGSNVIDDNGVRLETSRTMTVIREYGELILVNSIRLTPAGLDELARLGRVTHVIRLGAFHGRDDAFYQREYGAKLWAYPSMMFKHGERVDHDVSSEALPLRNARMINFATTQFPEGVLFMERHDGVLISCDSIKNWHSKDRFFDDDTFALFQTIGSIGSAKIDATWLNAMKPAEEEIALLATLPFAMLITAHGPALMQDARAAVKRSVDEAIMVIKK